MSLGKLQLIKMQPFHCDRGICHPAGPDKGRSGAHMQTRSCNELPLLKNTRELPLMSEMSVIFI